MARRRAACEPMLKVRKSRVSLQRQKMSLHQNSFPKFWRWPTSAGIRSVTLRWSACNRRWLDDYGGSSERNSSQPATGGVKPGRPEQIGRPGIVPQANEVARRLNYKCRWKKL